MDYADLYVYWLSIVGRPTQLRVTQAIQEGGFNDNDIIRILTIRKRIFCTMYSPRACIIIGERLKPHFPRKTVQIDRAIATLRDKYDVQP